MRAMSISSQSSACAHVHLYIHVCANISDQLHAHPSMHIAIAIISGNAIIIAITTIAMIIIL